MSTADHKRLILDAIETLWTKKDLIAYRAFLSPSFADHTDRTPGSGRLSGQPAGPTEFLRGLGAMLKAFPDMACTVDDVFGERDRVATRFTMSGTHLGPELGFPPTGVRVTFRGGAIERVGDDGKIAERWSYTDDVHLLAQLGVLKGPEKG